MVFYFKARPEAGDYTIFMGLDKYENEELIKYGFPEDIWFHVDKMSSAHVYLRLRKGQTIDDISEGNKVNNIDVVYTPWANLKKTASMDAGQVGFHNSKMVRTVRAEKRLNEVVNRLNKTKVERKPDLKAEREAVNAAERAERKLLLRDKLDRYELYLIKIDLFGTSSSSFRFNFENRIPFLFLGLLPPLALFFLLMISLGSLADLAVPLVSIRFRVFLGPQVAFF
ncbi:hypothetical protein OIU84_000303 [Salix udensis]|uniref:NFACT RNA-binding domain-containing protein n=1 Tax=Salix udensis TaxID=889485 RepID=A0AAD6L4J9_9ROSI|nr:hypothetical protein OIU84_000303 [Salix udensis]